MPQKKLSDDAKDQIALALLLLKDPKTQESPEESMEIIMYILELVEHLGVLENYNRMMPIVPVMQIKPRDE